MRNGRVLLDVKYLNFDQPVCYAIVGHNGAGKTLLARTLAGLQQPDQGLVQWAGKSPDKARRTQVGLLLQRPILLRRTAQANIEYALHRVGITGKKARSRAQSLLQQAGLLAVANTPSRVLSGGEQQRLALARALALHPEMLILDEPTANVDPVSTLPIEKMLLQAVADGCCAIIISHDMGQVKRVADEVIFMHAGRVLEQTPSSQFFSQPASEQGQAFVAGDLLV